MMIRQNTREVEDNGAESACRGIANIACTRCTEAINTQYREEKGLLLLLLEFVVIVVGEGDSCVKKEESAAAEEHRRGTVQ
jgi:hypothetical protein